MQINNSNIALVHDWFLKRSFGGAEKVTLLIDSFLSKSYKNPDVYSLTSNIEKLEDIFLRELNINTSFIQKLPFGKTNVQNFLPLLPFAIEQINLEKYDLIISSSHAFSKGVLTNPYQLHISYVHTPMRYAWDQMNNYLDKSAYSRLGFEVLIRYFLYKLRQWDFSSSQKIDYIIEGKRLIESALDFNANIGPIFCSDNFLKENKTWMKKHLNKSIRIKIIDRKTLSKISNTKSPQGILTICDIPKHTPIKLTTDKWIYLDKISDPGNMGTLIRSCAWFGIKNIALSPDCADPYNPKSIRAAMGTHFVITLHKNINLKIFKKTHKIIAADLKGGNASAYKFSKKCVLVLGSEAHGISNNNQDYVEDFIFINKLGFGNSLNVSAAGSILIYLLMKN